MTVPPPVDTPASRTAASWLMKFIDKCLDALGMKHLQETEEILYLIIVIAMALLLGWIIQKAVYLALRKLVQMRDSTVGRELLQWKTISRCCYIIAPLFIMAMAPFAFVSNHKTIIIIERCAGVYALVALGIGLAAVFDFAFNHYNIHENTRKLPIKGLVNIAKGILWIIITILAFSIILDKSPAMLLTGLGAFAAALMLVFKDSILGFVAGIQMSENDMLHVGDWIVIPGTPANGVVLDVTLTAVKIRNWDNTIVTVPPYTLVSTSFQNYRGMKESGARRIVKTLTMDLTTVIRLDDATTDAIVAKHPILAGFVDNLRKEGRKEQNDGGLTPINGTIVTNLGLFRAYICLYIMQNPDFAKAQQVLIRLMDATPNGLPLEIYCFTSTTDWDKYEGIHSSLLEHVSTIVSDFAGLAVYSSSSLTVVTDNDDSASSTSVPITDKKNSPAEPDKPATGQS